MLNMMSAAILSPPGATGATVEPGKTALGSLQGEVGLSPPSSKENSWASETSWVKVLVPNLTGLRSNPRTSMIRESQ